MRNKGVCWELIARKYYNMENLNGTIDLMNGAPLKVAGDGVGLIRYLYAALEKTDATVRYNCPVQHLLTSGDTVYGVRTREQDEFVEYYGQVILASRGFSANPAMLRQYLGEGWDLVAVRGTRYNTETMLRGTIDAGARPIGHWGGAYASPQDIDAPPMGDIAGDSEIFLHLRRQRQRRREEVL